MKKTHIYSWKIILIAYLTSCLVTGIDCLQDDREEQAVFPSENHTAPYESEGKRNLNSEHQKDNVGHGNLISNVDVKDDIVGVLAEITSKNIGALNDVTTDATVVVTLPETASSELKAEVEKLSATASMDPVAPFNVTDASAKAAAELETANQKAADEVDELKNDTTTVNETTEEIPSFSEWAQKRMEEAEKKNFANESSGVGGNGKTGSGVKLGWKNYASPDCGAKVVAANAEAVSPSSVISPSREEYKLNVCTNRIWFIVELCEAIQAKKIDIANFELFSSTPKEFTVSIGDRFPSREWSTVGQFTAKDERDVQSFDLDPHLFGRYIKVEVKSHHGSQHYCPISLFRVYGVSELEVLQKEELSHVDDDDLDDNDESETSPDGLTKNMLNSATNAVYSMIKKAAEVLGTKSNATDDKKDKFEYSPLINTCSTPSHNVACLNCTDVLFGRVYELLSCKNEQIQRLLQQTFIRKALIGSHVCRRFGLTSNDLQLKTTFNKRCHYVQSVFTESVVAAMCNMMSVSENKAVLNESQRFPNATLDMSDVTAPVTTQGIELSTDLNVPEGSGDLGPTDELKLDLTGLELPKVTCSTVLEYTSQIKPTKTITLEVSVESSSTETEEFDSQMTRTEGQAIAGDVGSAVNAKVDSGQEMARETVEVTTELPEVIDHMEHFIGDVNGEIGPSTASPISTGSNPADRQKESVFLRLSNRIKALERNVSLSSQYLEELSRRYKKQVEEMQKLEKTIQSMLDERKKMEDKNQQLEDRLDRLIITMEKWPAFIFWCLTTIIFFGGICWICGGDRQNRRLETSETVKQRRQSVDVIGTKEKKKLRRPSDQALKIVRSSLIAEERKLSLEKRRRKKSNKGLKRSNSVNEFDVNEYRVTEHDNTQHSLNKGNLSISKRPGDWIEENRRVLEVVDLDESENSSLEQFGTIIEHEVPHYTKTATDRRASRISSHYIKPNINGVQDFPPYSFKVKESDNSTESLNKKELGRRSSLNSKLEEGNRKKEKRSFKSVFKNVFT